MMARFTEFINKTQMTAFAGFVGQLGWLYAIVRLTNAASTLFLREGSGSEHHSYGLQLAIAVFGALGYKSTVNAASNHGNRKTAPEYVEAQERGKAQAGRPALQAQNVEKVEIKTQSMSRRQTDRPSFGPTEPNVYLDDERGDHA